MRDEALQVAMDNLRASLDAARVHIERRDAERRADILARMEAGEQVWIADAVWATNGACLDDGLREALGGVL